MSTAIVFTEGMVVVLVTATPSGHVVAAVLAGLMKLRMVPLASTTRMVALAHRYSCLVGRWNAMARTLPREADVAGPLSPLMGGEPVPAKVVTVSAVSGRHERGAGVHARRETVAASERHAQLAKTRRMRLLPASFT